MAAPTAPVISLEHVTLVYDQGTRALDDVSLSIAAGERVCVLGANGSGKSTLASVLCGLLAPDEGTVDLVGERVLDGGDVDLEAYRRARHGIGLVFQNPDDQIVTTVVAEDVAFGPENLGVPSDQIGLRVARELHRVALDDYAGMNPARLSGGQKQRVAIAGALAMERQVLCSTSRAPSSTFADAARSCTSWTACTPPAPPSSTSRTLWTRPWPPTASSSWTMGGSRSRAHPTRSSRAARR